MINFSSSSRSEKLADRDEQHDKADTGNDPSREPQSVAQQVLADAIARGQTGFEGLNAVRPLLLSLLADNQRLHYQISRAFGGQPFDLNLSPTCPTNLRRFKTYTECRNEQLRILGRLIELLMLSCGFQNIRKPARGRGRRRRR